jgi:hypothetical protein
MEWSGQCCRCQLESWVVASSTPNVDHHQLRMPPATIADDNGADRGQNDAGFGHAGIIELHVQECRDNARVTARTRLRC